jgi:hypothetical protein
MYKEGKAYKIIEEISTHNFANKDGSVNQQVLGLYVHEKNCNHVLQMGSKFLICEVIEDAKIIEDV